MHCEPGGEVHWYSKRIKTLKEINDIKIEISYIIRNYLEYFQVANVLLNFIKNHNLSRAIAQHLETLRILSTIIVFARVTGVLLQTETPLTIEYENCKKSRLCLSYQSV